MKGEQNNERTLWTPLRKSEVLKIIEVDKEIFGERQKSGTDEPAMKGIFIVRAVSYMCLASAQL